MVRMGTIERKGRALRIEKRIRQFRCQIEEHRRKDRQNSEIEEPRERAPFLEKKEHLPQ
jgi:hypothetical protein